MFVRFRERKFFSPRFWIVFDVFHKMLFRDSDINVIRCRCVRHIFIFVPRECCSLLILYVESNEGDTLFLAFFLLRNNKISAVRYLDFCVLSFFSVNFY